MPAARIASSSTRLFEAAPEPSSISVRGAAAATISAARVERISRSQRVG